MGSVIMSNSKKPYNVNLGFIPDFYIPHPESNHLNAQDIVHALLVQALNTAIATQSCFEDDGKLDISPYVISNLIWTIQTKLEMIERILPLAFQGEEV